MDVLDPVWRRRAQQAAALPQRTFLRKFKSLLSSSPRWADEALRLRYRHQRGEFLRYVLPETFKFRWNAFHQAVLSTP